MLFSSPIFAVFFLTFLLFYRFVPANRRLWLMIIGSTIFYGYWNPIYTPLPFVLSGMAFVLAKWSLREEPPGYFRLALAITILVTPLLVVKYTNFFARALFSVTEPIITGGIPLGISFVTFTLIAFVVDVRVGRYKGSRSLSEVLGFTLFFPHLIAGPILRPAELMPQLNRLPDLAGRTIFIGLAIFTFGLVKKLVFADPIGEAVDTVYRQAATAGFLDVLLAFYGFSIQIYCDFSGYTDMAIGSALILGVRLPNNFDRPYCAISIIDFWRRWHITLSHWLRDYIYIPLGGNRGGFVRTQFNLLTTMLLGGLWHGANWTFIIWGGLHGLALVINHSAPRFRLATALGRLPAWVRSLLTFHVVGLLWVIFRSPDMSTAAAIYGGFQRPAGDIGGFFDANAFVLILGLVFFVTHRVDDHRRVMIYAAQNRYFYPVLVSVVMAWMIAITVSTGSSGKFVYFDF